MGLLVGMQRTAELPLPNRIESDGIPVITISRREPFGDKPKAADDKIQKNGDESISDVQSSEDWGLLLRRSSCSGVVTVNARTP